MAGRKSKEGKPPPKNGAMWRNVALIGATLGLASAARRITRRAQMFDGRVVVITGGSRGLGLELARAFAGAGARVAICARTPADLARAAEEFNSRGCSILARVCDVRDAAACAKFIEAVVARFGRIDVLVNNAGIIQAGPLSCMTRDDFERAMATHFWGPFNLIDKVLPLMRAQSRGNIVNIASIGGEIGVPHLIPYCASKFALVGLSEGLATELQAEGIRVTTVCPGLMRTGSPRNAEFKGQHRAEYAWFSISDSLPGLSTGSRAAARQIVAATYRSDRHLRITLPAKIAPPLRGISPGLIGFLLALANRFLPAPTGARSAESKRGFESHSRWSPSWLTRLTERAAARNNELGSDGKFR